MDKLKELLTRCKCGVFLIVNEHRDYYQTVEQRLEEVAGYECPPEIAPEVRAAMIATDTMIDLQFYPDTPIGSYRIVHYDLDAALDEALNCLTPNAPHEGPGAASSRTVPLDAVVGGQESALTGRR